MVVVWENRHEMNDFWENTWECLTSLWRQPEEGELSPEDKKVLQQQFEIRQAMHGLETRHYDVDGAWQKVRPKRGRRWVLSVCKYAAVLVLGVFVAHFFVRQESEEKVSLAIPEQVKPGKLQAKLYLATGEYLALDEHQGTYNRKSANVKIVNDTATGKVSYHVNESVAGDAVAYNTLVVPKGGEYCLLLADGTTVHLNADSELKYPETFTGKERKVFLKGEAWFEVAKDSERAFYVETDEVKIRVYGTSFNVNTHGLQAMETVLVSGEIGISARGNAREWRMNPGQLACYDRSNGGITLKKVDVNQYISWKKGEFCFNDDTLEEILEELGRWYDVTVFFRSPARREVQFSGHLKRYEDIRKILHAITESTGINFEINGHAIIVK